MLCKYCGEERLETEFEIANVIKGVVYRRKKCYKCKQFRQTERRHEIRDKFITYKQSLSCSQCGYSDYRALEFHHLDPKEKEDNVSNLIGQGRSIESIKHEMSKCIVLCANCHKIIHAENR